MDRYVSRRSESVPGSPAADLQLLCTLFLVPEQVSALNVLPVSDSRTLRLSWAPPRGHWDNYSILLKNGSEVLVNQTISKPSTQHTFSVVGLSLVPGRVYEAEVTVHSGILGNTARCYVQLGKFTPSFCTNLVWDGCSGGLK